jgi:hypothetical protein
MIGKCVAHRPTVAVIVAMPGRARNGRTLVLGARGMFRPYVCETGNNLRCGSAIFARCGHIVGLSGAVPSNDVILLNSLFVPFLS